MPDPLSIGSGIVGILSVTIQIIQILDKFAREWKDVPENVKAFLQEVNNLHLILQKSEELLVQDDTFIYSFRTLTQNVQPTLAEDDTVEIIVSSKKELLTLKDALMINTNTSANKGWKRILRAIRADALRQSMDTVYRHCSQVNNLISLQSNRITKATRFEVQQLASELSKWHEEEQFQDILRWISKSDFDDQHAEHLSKWHVGTGSWLLDEDDFTDWRNGLSMSDDAKPVPSVLWLYGIPGAGKTVITSMVIHHLNKVFDNDVAIAYVYCEYKNQFEQDARSLLASLVRQVAIQSKHIPESVLKSYRKHANGANSASLATYTELLSQLLTSFRRSFLVVDALDEYTQEETPHSNKLLDGLIKITRSQSKCRVLITSREDCLSLHSNVESKKIRIDAKPEDVRMYVNARIRDRTFPFSEQVNKDASFAAAIIDNVASKAHGQFLLPSLHINHLAEQISARKCKEQLKALPRDINDLYEASFRRVTEQSEARKTIGLKILCWVLHAAQPLHVNELRHALAIEEGDEQFDEEGMFDPSLLLGTTKGLITLNMDEIHFVHYTAKEYFTTIDDDTFPDAEKEITQTCISYLKLKDFETPCKPYQLETRYEKFPFLWYAAMHWGYHTTKSDDTALGIEARDFIAPGSIPLGSLQVIASKVLNLLWPDRIRGWKLPQLQMAIVCNLEMIVRDAATSSPKHVLDEKGYKDETALHIAARVGSEESVRLLLEYGADVNATSYSGKTALDIIMAGPYMRTSIKISQLEDKALVAARHLAPEPYSQDELLLSDLMPFVVEKLLKATTDLEPIPDVTGWQRSTSVVLNGGFKMDIFDEEEDIVRLLIEHGVDVNSQLSSEQTALQLASIYGRFEIVRLLLASGANPFLTREMGWTALELAKKCGHHEIALILEEKMTELKRKELELVEEAAKLDMAGPYQARYLETRGVWFERTDGV